MIIKNTDHPIVGAFEVQSGALYRLRRFARVSRTTLVVGVAMITFIGVAGTAFALHYGSQRPKTATKPTDVSKSPVQQTAASGQHTEPAGTPVASTGSQATAPATGSAASKPSVPSNATKQASATTGSKSVTASSVPTVPSQPTSGNTTSQLTPQGVGGSWHLIFDDEFSGNAINNTVWSPNWFGDGNTQNDTVMRTSHVSVSGGSSNLLADSNGGGLLSTNPNDGQPGHKGFQFTYGYMEARMYLPGSGTQIANWPAFWADGQNWPNDGEIDVMEGIYGTAQYHIHYGTASSPQSQAGTASGNYSGWHTFGASWQPNSMTFYYDGKQVGQFTSGITSSPMYLILENSTGQYSGPSVLPSTVQVDYVRVWQ